jgi:3-phosphoshikimate 1-carboxyvinyltransferase
LLINYIKNGTILPILENDPNDIKVVYNALKTIDLQKKTSVGEECEIDVQDCGAAYRFFMALLAVTKGKWLLTGTDRLLQRPILPLVNFLKEKGASIEKTETGWRIEGKELQIDNFEIDTSETSQFASAVMMVNAVCGMRYAVSGMRCEVSGMRYAVCGEAKSPSNFEGVPEGRGSLYNNPYIKMTQIILNKYANCRDTINRVSVLADWSAAVFWLANALLVPNAHYLLKDLHFDELQGDASIAPWFEKWGLVFTEKENGIEVKHISHVAIPKQKMDVSQTPDLAMILAVLSVCYPFELTMSGLKNLNLKESNRLDIMVKELSKLTKVEKHSEDIITIYKRTEKLPKLFQFDSYNDHRFVMAWSLFRNFGKIEIKNAECIKKSYPTFEPLTTNH